MKKLFMLLMVLALAAAPLAANAEGAVLTKIENGASGDFDGDGTTETVAFATQRDEYDDGGFTLTVGGTTVSQENCIALSEELYAVSVPYDAYYAENDLMGTLFMAFEYGPSDDPVSYCYFYTDGALYDAGTIEALPTAMQFFGREIRTTLRSDLLGTWSRPATFVLGYGHSMEGDEYKSDYHLAEVPQDVYAMGLISKTKVELPLQVSRTDDASAGTIPAGAKLTFAATDNLHWVYAESMDGGVRGWFYVDSSDYPTMVRVNGTMTSADEVFDNLMYAD